MISSDNTATWPKRIGVREGVVEVADTCHQICGQRLCVCNKFHSKRGAPSCRNVG